MPLIQVQFQPGIDKQLTDTGAQGKWVDCDNVRFRYGMPEKIGGWTSVSTAALIGATRAQLTYSSVDSIKLDFLATNKKQYIFQETDNTMNDVSPQRYGDYGHTGAAVVLSNAFSTTGGSNIVTVHWTANGAAVGDFITFVNVTPPVDGSAVDAYSATSFTDKPFEIQTVDTNSFTIEMATQAAVTSLAQNGSATATTSINTGDAISTLGFGWGAGLWGQTTWGTARPTTVEVDAVNWTSDLYGEDVIACRFQGGIYIWDTSAYRTGMNPMINLIDYNLANGPLYFSRNQNSSSVPSKNGIVVVSTPDRHLCVFGTELTIGSSNTYDPMLIRFSDQEKITDFVITADNTAGSQRLGDGTEIRAAVSTKGQIIVLTDTSAHSMQFIGPPFTFGFQQLGKQCGCVGQHAAIDVDGIVYWMGSSGGFLAFDGAVKGIPCTVEDYVFNDIRLVPEIYAGVNADFNEVSWYYPTANSNEINRVVTFNYLENVWSVGSLDRTTWADKGAFDKPYATKYSPNSTVTSTPAVQGVSPGRSTLYAQETGNSDDGSAMTASLESGDFSLDGAGNDLLSVSRFIPDFKNLTGDISVALELRDYSSQAQRTSPLGPFTIDATTPYVDCRARGRQVAIKLDSSGTNDSWRFGTFRAGIKPSGKR